MKSKYATVIRGGQSEWAGSVAGSVTVNEIGRTTDASGTLSPKGDVVGSNLTAEQMEMDWNPIASALVAENARRRNLRPNDLNVPIALVPPLILPCLHRLAS